jgi:hypothetical protein
MRNFINLCESLIPPVDRAAIINHMISHVGNGDYWDRDARPRGSVEPIGDESAIDMARDWGLDAGDGSEIPNSPEFVARLRQWGEARYAEVIDKLNAVPLHAGRFVVHRSIRVMGEFQPKDGLGIYWTFDYDNADYEAPWSEHDYEESSEVLMHALVEPRFVDWRNTILANMCWMSGDQEHEMRLIKGSPLMLLDVNGETVNKVFSA